MPDPTPTQAINKRGLHVHHPLSLIPLWDAVQRKAIVGVTITFGSIGDEYWQLANELVNYLDYVVLRKVLSDHDNPVQDYEEYHSDPRVIYQFGNEAAIEDDCIHWMQVMMAGTAHNRRVIIYNDPVGWTEDSTWFRRAAAHEYAKRNHHFIGVHCYGNVTFGGDYYKPMIDPVDLGSFRWFFGRVFHLYDLVPESMQANFIANEAGAGGWQQNGTAGEWKGDVQRVNDFTQGYPWFRAFNLWTLIGPGWGFDRDSIDGYVGLL